MDCPYLSDRGTALSTDNERNGTQPDRLFSPATAFCNTEPVPPNGNGLFGHERELSVSPSSRSRLDRHLSSTDQQKRADFKEGTKHEVMKISTDIDGRTRKILPNGTGVIVHQRNALRRETHCRIPVIGYGTTHGNGAHETSNDRLKTLNACCSCCRCVERITGRPRVHHTERPRCSMFIPQHPRFTVFHLTPQSTIKPSALCR